MSDPKHRLGLNISGLLNKRRKESYRIVLEKIFLEERDSKDHTCRNLFIVDNLFPIRNEIES
jgi:hypothetical protein